jgi:hypothetical protein
MKIYELLGNNNEKIKNDIDDFLFFDGEWRFVENIDYIRLVIDYMDVTSFIKIGLNISDNLNQDNITVEDYDISCLNKYIDLI